MDKTLEKTNLDECTPKELVFAELLADHTDGRTVEEKAIEAGWKDGKHGYAVKKRERVIAARARFAERNRREMLTSRNRVLASVERRACDDTRSDCTENAKLYMQIIGEVGTGGVNINQRIEQNGNTGDNLERRLQLDERERVVSEN